MRSESSSPVLFQAPQRRAQLHGGKERVRQDLWQLWFSTPNNAMAAADSHIILLTNSHGWLNPWTLHTIK